MKAIITGILAVCLTCAGVAEGRSVARTASTNGAWTGRVRHVLNHLDGDKPSMEEVEQLLRTGRSFRYKHTDPYLAALPSETARTRRGDCKDRSLWLIDQMGDRNARYVIGKAHRGSRMNHAWVKWNDGNRWWILDPTKRSRPIPADSVGSNSYIPLMSFSPSGTTRNF